MKIGFEATRTIATKPTGVNRYARNLISAVMKANPDFEVTVYYKAPRIGKRKHWLNRQEFNSTVHFGKFWPVFNRPNVIHGLDGYVPDWKNSKRIVTIHDIYPLIRDEDDVSPKGFRDKLRRNYTEVIGLADHVVTVSDRTRRDVINEFGVAESKITTVYSGSETPLLHDLLTPDSKRPTRYSRPYLLFVGSLSGRKNTARLVRAYAQSKARADYDLVLAGSIAYKGEETIETVAKLGLQNSVHLTDYVSLGELNTIYTGASGFVFPTLYEGFGFPILDAMIHRLPVLASNAGSAPEIANGFALLVDPFDIESIANGIDKLTDASSSDLEGARKHALGFTWDKCAAHLLEIYR